LAPPGEYLYKLRIPYKFELFSSVGDRVLALDEEGWVPKAHEVQTK